MGGATFRERARRQFETAFGVPAVLATEAGSLYRWVLTRAPRSSLYVTLDSPEMTHLAHVLVSDPLSTQLDPVSSVVMRTDAEVASAVARIRAQRAGVPESDRP